MMVLTHEKREGELCGWGHLVDVLSWILRVLKLQKCIQFTVIRIYERENVQIIIVPWKYDPWFSKSTVWLYPSFFPFSKDL